METIRKTHPDSLIVICEKGSALYKSINCTNKIIQVQYAYEEVFVIEYFEESKERKRIFDECRG